MNHIQQLLAVLMLLLVGGIGARAQYNPTNPAEPGATHTLTLKSVPADAGTFNISTVSQYSPGSTVSLRTYANTGYTFANWELSDGTILSTSASYSYTMPSASVTLVARYKYDPTSPGEPDQPNLPVYSTLTISANPTDGGYCNIASGNKYEVGSTVTLTARAYSNFVFTSWTADGEVVSTSSTFKYVVTQGDHNIVANFTYAPNSPDEPSEPRLKHTLTLNTNPIGGGYFNIASGNQYEEGSTVSIYAYAYQYYTFKNWTTADGTAISSDYRLSYVMPTTDVTLTANYTYNYSPSNPGEPNKPSDTEPNIYCLSETMPAGATTNIPIYLENATSAIGMIVDVSFADGFTVNTDGITTTGRVTDQQLTVGDLGNNTYRLTLSGSQPLSGDNGKVLDIPVTASATLSTTSYPITLTHGVVINADGSQTPITVRSGCITIQKSGDGSLYARFSFDKYQDRVKFSNLSASTATSYLWDFGDGTTSTEASPLHQYAAAGTYTVRLTVKNADDTDIAEQSILVNDASTWTASGTYYLSDALQTVRHFTTFGQLLSMLKQSRLDGNITISVQASQTFATDLDAATIALLRDLEARLSAADLHMTFIKNGSGNNPTISYGIDTPTTYDTSAIDILVALGSRQTYRGVDMRIWGITFDTAQLAELQDMETCSGEKTQAIDLSPISTDMTFAWTMSSEVDSAVSGYATSGSRVIPAMAPINETTEDAVLVYNIKATYNGRTFYTFPITVTVHPALTGMFTTLTPRDNTNSETANLTLSWNTIPGAVYDLYVWNVTNPVPTTPVLNGTSQLRYDVSKLCTNGNTYKWFVTARNQCQSITGDTLTFSITALPDLHVSAIELSAATAGKDLTINWTVTNDGTGPTGSTAWTDYIWMVPDVYVGTSSSAYMTGGNQVIKLLKSVPNLKSLEPGANYRNTATVTLDERVYGDYYIIVAADMYDVRDIQWQAVNNTVPNPYTPSANGSPYSYLYATTTASYNKVDERNEHTDHSDNFFYTKMNIAVPDLVDLAVTDVSATVDNANSTTPSPLTNCGLGESTEFYSGKNCIVTAKVKNVGGLKLTNGNFRSILYISHTADGEDKTSLATASTSSANIATNGSIDVKFNGQIPYGWYGETYFFVNIDVDDNIYELASKDNNWGHSEKIDVKLTPTADFSPRNLKAPTSIAPQTPFIVSYEVKNIGPGIPFSNTWFDKIYISRNAKFDASAQSVAMLTRTGKFVKNETATGSEYQYSGDSYSVSQSVSPSQLSAGEYYVHVSVDSEDNVLEYDGEDNNILSFGPLTCTMSDLAIELSSISSDTITTNGTLAFAYKLRNAGTGTIKDIKVTDAFYASVNQDGSNAILLGTAENALFLEPETERTFRANITIPQNSALNGVMYVFVKTNYNNSLTEANTANNTSALRKTTFKYVTEAQPTVVRGTNITIRDLSSPTTVKPGEKATVRYNILNAGDRKVESDVTQEVFLSPTYSFDAATATPCAIVSKSGTTKGLAAQASAAFALEVQVPQTVYGGKKYLMVFADRANTLAEKETADNMARSNVTVDGNLPRITLSNIQVSDTIMSSEEIKVKWTTTNTGQWDAGTFRVGAYLSADDKWDSKDLLLGSVSVESLGKGLSINHTATISIADKNAGKWNILLRADDESRLTELSTEKSTIGRAVTVALSPIPDLTVKSMTVDGTARSGQSLKITSVFANIGKNATRQSRWSEDYYLSPGTTFNSATAVKLASRTHNGVLNIGDEYTSTLDVTLPPDIEGNFMLFALVDGADAIYEENENNNSRSIPIYVNGRNSNAGDLTISKITANSTILAGSEITISYDITNRGEYAAEGLCRDVIYLSHDNVLDNNDVMVGTVSGKISIEPGNTITRVANGRISNVVEGQYYIIIKTNSTRSIAETDDTNNVAVQTSPSRLSFADLALDGSAAVKTSGLYKFAVPDGYDDKTIGIYLDHDAEVSGGLYVAYEKVPTTAVYDVASATTHVERQEALIARARSGNYYVLAQDNGSAVNVDNLAFSLEGTTTKNSTPLTLSARELHFGATSLSQIRGGTGGWITSEIKGALLDSIMDFRLVSGADVIPVERLDFKSTTSARVTFNLTNASTGTYDVVSELADGTSATMQNGFEVVPGAATGLEIKLDVPGSVRLGAVTPVSLTYFNNGANDAEIYEMLVTIEAGGIGSSYEAAEKNGTLTYHIVPDGEKNRMGLVSIEPGTKQVVNFFIYTGNSSSNSMSVYIVK
jgi:PKD repeat protein